MKEKLQQYQFIIDNINYPIFAVDNASKVIVINKAAEAALPLKVNNVMGLSLSEIFENSPYENQILPRTLKGEEFKDYIFTDTLTNSKKLIANATTIKDNDGKILGAVNYFKDVTELLHLQKKSDALEQLLQQHHFIMNSTHNLILIIDNDTNIKVWNKAMENMTGFKASDMIGTNLQDLVNKYNVPSDPFITSLQKGKEFKNKNFKFRFGNKSYDLLVNSKIIRNKTEILGAMFICTDITELSKQQKIVEQNERLAAISQLAAGLAHEIKNPLTAARGLIQLMQDRHPDHSNFFDVIVNELDHTNNLLNNLLLLEKPPETPLRIININSLLKETINFMISHVVLKNVQILDQVAKTQTYVLGNSEQLNQVFVNIIKNAVQAIKNKGTITISSKKRKNKIELTFKDNGKGIPENVLPKIFDLMFSTNKMGTGLGLSLCKQIIHNHYGSIEAFNNPEGGATIKIILPVTN